MTLGMFVCIVVCQFVFAELNTLGDVGSLGIELL